MDALKKYQKIESDFFQGWTKRNPFLSTDLGIHDQDDRFVDGTWEKLQDDIRFLKQSLHLFETVDVAKLPRERQTDAQVAMHHLRLRLFELEVLRIGESAPEAPRMIGHGLFQLLFRNYAPLKERLQSIMKRLEMVPKYIEQSKSRLRHPNKILIENELETITRIPGFFHAIKDVARNAMSQNMFFKLHKLLEDVHDALEVYSDWLIVDILSECPVYEPVGEANFRRLLELRGISETPGALISWGEREMHGLRAKLKEAGRKIKRKVEIEDIRDIVRQERPDHFDGVLRGIRDRVNRSRQFVSKSGFFPLPEGETLYVIEMPSYLRHMKPLTTYWPPAPLEEKKEGFFLVTPGDCDSDRMKKYNDPTLTNMSLHEGYPGAHLFHSWAAGNPSRIRHLWHAPETVSGWSHYCEERVREMGFEDSPLDVFASTEDLVWRAVRMVLDTKLSTGKLAISKAVEMLIDDVGVDRVIAEAEVRRHLLTPGEGLSYLYGKQKVLELKKWMKDRMKARFQESFFHTALMQSGAIPLSLMKKELEWRVEEELKKPAPKVEEPASHPPAKGGGKHSKKGTAPTRKTAPMAGKTKEKAATPAPVKKAPAGKGERGSKAKAPGKRKLAKSRR